MAKRNRNTWDLVCAFCGKSFKGPRWPRQAARFCSRTCSAKRRSGALNPHWHGGVKRRGLDGRVFVLSPGHQVMTQREHARLHGAKR
jgi:hypothetical protein